MKKKFQKTYLRKLYEVEDFKYKMTNKHLVYSLFHGIIFVCKSTCPVSNLNPLEALLRWEGPWVLRYSCQGCSTADSREKMIEPNKRKKI